MQVLTEIREALEVVGLVHSLEMAALVDKQDLVLLVVSAAKSNFTTHRESKPWLYNTLGKYTNSSAIRQQVL
jgi:hypothetical protein